MAKATGYVLTKEEAGRVQSVVEHVEQSPAYVRAARVRKPRQVGGMIRYAQLTATLSAGTQASPTTCAAKFRIRAAGDTALSDGETFTVTNRSDATGSSGDFCIVAWICGEWHIIAKDC